jgi:hypothetical protein
MAYPPISSSGAQMTGHSHDRTFTLMLLTEIIQEEIRDLILKAYHAMGAAKGQIEAIFGHSPARPGRARASMRKNRGKPNP